MLSDFCLGVKTKYIDHVNNNNVRSFCYELTVKMNSQYYNYF